MRFVTVCCQLKCWIACVSDARHGCLMLQQNLYDFYKAQRSILSQWRNVTSINLVASTYLRHHQTLRDAEAWIQFYSSLWRHIRIQRESSRSECAFPERHTREWMKEFMNDIMSRDNNIQPWAVEVQLHSRRRRRETTAVVTSWGWLGAEVCSRTRSRQCWRHSWLRLDDEWQQCSGSSLLL